MKFQCLGYFNREKMDVLTKEELDAIMSECQIHLEKFLEDGKVLIDAGIAKEMKTLQRTGGRIIIEDAHPDNNEPMIGSSFIIEAQDMEEAIEIASKHPTVQVQSGEKLGWKIEIRPIESFKARDQRP